MQGLERFSTNPRHCSSQVPGAYQLGDYFVYTQRLRPKTDFLYTLSFQSLFPQTQEPYLGGGKAELAPSKRQPWDELIALHEEQIYSLGDRSARMGTRGRWPLMFSRIRIASFFLRKGNYMIEIVNKSLIETQRHFGK